MKGIRDYTSVPSASETVFDGFGLLIRRSENMTNEETMTNDAEESSVDVSQIKQVQYAVAYARVSTKDKDQNPESQLFAIREWAKKKGNIKIVREFQDKSTGTNTNRDQYYMMKGYVDEHREVKMILALDADRISRNMEDATAIVKYFNSMGVSLVYISNESIDLSTSEGRLINQFYTYTGETHVAHQHEKIVAGMERARAEGKQIGRPLSRINQFNIDLILGYASMGYSLRDVAKIHHCSRVTITNRLKDENKLEDFKRIYNEAIGAGRIGPGIKQKKHKPKKVQDVTLEDRPDVTQ